MLKDGLSACYGVYFPNTLALFLGGDIGTRAAPSLIDKEQRVQASLERVQASPPKHARVQASSAIPTSLAFFFTICMIDYKGFV